MTCNLNISSFCRKAINFLLYGITRFYIFSIPIFLTNCWYLPADVFNNDFISRYQEFSPDRDAPFSEILASADKFHNHESTKEIFLKSGNKPLWIRFDWKKNDVKNTAAAKRLPRYLEFRTTYIKSLECYVPVRNSRNELEYIPKKNGLWLNIGQREIPFRNPIVEIPENIDQDESVYIKMNSDISLNFLLTFYSRDILTRRLSIDNYYFGIIFGILFAMLLNNMFVAIALKSKTYLYLILYIASIILFISNIYGQLWSVIEGSQNYQSMILWTTGGFVMIFSCQFVRHFLTTGTFSKKYDRIFFLITLLGISLIMLGIFGFYTAANLIARTFAIFAPLLYVGAGFLAIRNGLKSARLLFISWTILSISFIGIASKGIHLPFFNIFSYISLPAAFSIESILLSMALGDKIRRLQSEKEEAVKHGKRYEEMSITDSLTGFFNRRYFESKLQAEILHAKLLNRPLGLIVLDCDNFKTINDTYGHPQGDFVLKEISKVFSESKRKEDILCRYGGEEFACLLPGSDLQGAAKIAELMRQKCEELIFKPEAFSHFKVTISSGVTVMRADDLMDSLIDRADRLMYQAKRSGKNKTMVE